MIENKRPQTIEQQHFFLILQKFYLTISLRNINIKKYFKKENIFKYNYQSLKNRNSV